MKPRQLLSRVDSPDCSRFLWKLLLPFLFAKRPRPADKGPPRSLRTRCLHHLHHPNSRARGFVAFANTGAAGADHMRSLYFCSHLRVAWHIAQRGSWRGCSPPVLKAFPYLLQAPQGKGEAKRFLSKRMYHNAADGRIWPLTLHQGTPRIFQPLQIQPVDQLNQKGLRAYSCTRPAESTAKQRDVRQNAQRHFCQR